jgi:hypothetical protein
LRSNQAAQEVAVMALQSKSGGRRINSSVYKRMKVRQQAHQQKRSTDTWHGMADTWPGTDTCHTYADTLSA